MKATYTTTITVNQEEIPRLEKLRAQGNSIIGIFREGMDALELKGGQNFGKIPEKSGARAEGWGCTKV